MGLKLNRSDIFAHELYPFILFQVQEAKHGPALLLHGIFTGLDPSTRQSSRTSNNTATVRLSDVPVAEEESTGDRGGRGGNKNQC